MVFELKSKVSLSLATPRSIQISPKYSEIEA